MGTMALKCITPYVLITLLILFSAVIAKEQNHLSRWKYSSIPVKRKLIGYEPESMSTFQNKDEVDNPMTNVPIINPTTPDTDNTPVVNPGTSTPIIPMTPDPSTGPGTPNTNPGFGGGSPNTNPGFGGGGGGGGTPNTNPGFGGGGGGGGSPNTNPGFGGGGGVPNTNPGFGGGGNPSPNTNPGNAGTGQRWCVASQSASETALQVALDYACGYGGTDCSAINQGGNCYNPDTLRDHASYAFNQYYQKNPAPTSCDFGGTATLTNTDPSTQTCQFPSSSGNTVMGGNTTPSTPSVPYMSTPISGSPQFGSVPPDSDLSSAVLNSESIRKWMLRCITMLAVIFYTP